MNIVSILKDEIRLNSCMTELAFGKTNYNDIVSQTGVLAECKSYEDGKYEFEFSTWNFSDIKSFEVENNSDRFVFYCGKNPLGKNAKTFEQILEDAGKESSSKEDKDTMFEAGYIICSILTQVATENSSIPLNGSEGIILEINKEKTKVLFLPENLYKYSVGGLSPMEYATIQGCWLNLTLKGLPAICFNRAVIAYKMLTGRFPYESSDTLIYNADILDHNFLPIDLCINGINPELAKEINKGLKLNANIVAVPGKKQKGKSSEDLTPTPEFPLSLLYSFKSTSLKSKISNEEFEEKSTAYLKKMHSYVKTKRLLRRNKATIIIICCVLLTLGIIGNSMYKTSQDNYTSKGLTSTQTLEGFYWGINNKDTVVVGDFSRGKEMRGYSDSISQIYVISKQRQSYYQDQGFQTMEEWLFWSTTPEKEAKTGIYGITNLSIDGEPTDLDVKMYKNKDKPLPITEEKGIKLEKGSKSIHRAQYYLVYTEGEHNDIFVKYIEETATLTYKNDRWFVTDIDTEETPLRINSQEFKQDYFDMLQKNDTNIINSTEKLRFRYPWLPTKQSMIQEQNRLVEKYNDPYGFLK